MKINSEVFANFLNLIAISGSHSNSIKECIFRGTSNNLSVVAVTEGKTVAIKALLKGDFSSLGDVGIDNLPLLIKVVSSCSGEIEVSKTANKLKINAGKKVKASLVLRNIQYVLNEIEASKFDVLYTKTCGNSFTLDKSFIESFKKYYGILGKEIFISGEDNDVAFSVVSSDNEIELTANVPEKVEKFSVKIGEIFFRTLGLINTEAISMSVKDGSNSIAVEVKTADYEVTYLIVLMVK
jgi:hypothetical protein